MAEISFSGSCMERDKSVWQNFGKVLGQLNDGTTCNDFGFGANIPLHANW